MSELLNRCRDCIGEKRELCDETYAFALGLERELATEENGPLEAIIQMGMNPLDATALALATSRQEAIECFRIIDCGLEDNEIKQNIMGLKG